VRVNYVEGKEKGVSRLICVFLNLVKVMLDLKFVIYCRIIGDQLSRIIVNNL
jgi:hypothetical protein